MKDRNLVEPHWDRKTQWPPPLEYIRWKYNQPKMLHIEVDWNTLQAAKDNPGSLRIIVENAKGVTVIERPHRPRTEDNAGRTDYDDFSVLRKD
jgi:hypothetical protein